jgi:hypothetical protein
MPLIVVVLPGAQVLLPELDDPPLLLLSGTIRLLPLPPLANTGAPPLLLLVPPAAGVCPEPALGVMPLPGLLEFPHAIEPSKAMPVHKENGMVFISNFLRSIGVRHASGGLVAHTQVLSAEQCSRRRARPYDLECSDSMPCGAIESEY